MGIKLTKYDIIKNFIKVHKDEYDYSLVNFINTKTKVKIICKKHGIFEQRPNDHSQGQKCPKCNGRNIKLTKEEIINKSNKIHNNKYEYSLFLNDNDNNYKTQKTIIKIICPIHGIFKQQINNHLNGKGCKYCANNIQKTNENFIKESNIIHNNEWNYSLCNYIDAKTKVKIICKKHGIFQVTPNNHINKKSGCPKCNIPKGEKYIESLLKNNNINFETQKIFNDCKYKKLLKFDFYLPEYNSCIEHDGIQHFEPLKFFGGIEKLEKLKKRDQIKNEYCKNNNINLLRIKYNDNIEEKLKNFLNI